MKKLERLKINQLQEFTRIGDEEQMMLKGGENPWDLYVAARDATYVQGPDIIPLDELYSQSYNYGASVQNVQDAIDQSCPQCEMFYNSHDRTAHYGGFELTPFGKWVFNTLPHQLGIGGHK